MFRKLFVLFLIEFFVSACMYSHSNSDTGSTGLEDFCKSFVKTICTKDTSNFYKLADTAYLTESMNKWIHDGKRINSKDLFFPFFFVFSPLEIRSEELIYERNKKPFFKDFKIEQVQKINDISFRVKVNWTENEINSKPDNIELAILKIKDEWKVVEAKWKTL